ncbi:hypothetical protein Y032_0478g2201 [Ancylostoma ceylanicum]|uniref:Metalloendopeptidase n=1 Tax=Ancylostoma ceylanicum TaxID=53326 RepID=A0A016WW33_9BILA|nr:hypothetical protein Y032_0478g2201 [Ancylostoma ceylanicum]
MLGLKFHLRCIFLLTLANIVASISPEAKSSLLKDLGGTSLEDRRARLRNLGTLFFGNRTGGTQQMDSTIVEGAQQPLDPVGELNIEEINEREGIAEYLFQDTKKKTLVQKALNYIRWRTCLDFIESSTAENRIRVFNGSGCYSWVGMKGGAQDLSLANHCDTVGVVSHEFIHSLGTWHMQMRDDRDNFIRVDLTNVKPELHGNFAKVAPGESINYNPYEYGSVMHYAAALFSSGSNSLVPLEGQYLRTLGSRVVSFYDIKTINDHYSCHAKCGAGSAVCNNGGEPNPRNCSVCNCPDGYGGALCNQRPAGCGQGLAATPKWQVKQFTFGNAAVTTIRDDFAKCNHWITAPAGKKVQVRVTFIKNPQQCNNGCKLIFIEPKTKSHKRVVNPRICCTDMLNRVYTSSLNPTPIMSYNRFQTSTFTFHYRYI